MFACGGERAGNLQYVDPTIGGVGHLLEPTRPIAHLPNSMVRVYPVRKDHLDDQIDYFPLSVHSHRTGNIFYVMPAAPGAQAGSKPVPQAYDLEQTAPHYYTAVLEASQVQIEFTPGERSGYFRFTSPEGGIVLHAGILNEGSLALTDDRTLTGTEEFRGMRAYVYAELSEPVTGAAAENSRDLLLSTPAGSLEVRYGLSYISVEQARGNLQQEIPAWGFEQVKKHAANVWEEKLGQIAVEGGTEAQRRVFYTALYRTYERMVDIGEYGRYYSGYDHRVHDDPRPFYVDNWIWDSYLAHEPLHMILDPAREADKIASYVRMYEQSGWLPSFALVFGDDPRMTGNHAAAWICDAWHKGIRDFDARAAYEAMCKNSTQATLLPWRNGPRTVLDDFYADHGYFPALRPGEEETVPEVESFEKRQSVAVTLAQSYDDWCIARMAAALGHGKDEQFFLARSQNYRNVFRTEKGFVWPRDAKGEWIEPFDPRISGGLGGRQYFTENNAYTYDWDVKHDLYSLFELMGGAAKAEEKLDRLFREELAGSKYNYFALFPDATGLVGQFVMGNEPGFHIPYLYNYLGAPWKTQKRIRSLLESWFMDNVFGIPGDDDGGGMSAFALFSMMGFYPVTPGQPVYAIGSPVFEKVTVRLPNGRSFTVKADGNSPQSRYIRSATFNGKPWDKAWFTHEELLAGGTLCLTMDETPNKAWGSCELPPAAITEITKL